MTAAEPFGLERFATVQAAGLLHALPPGALTIERVR